MTYFKNRHGNYHVIDESTNYIYTSNVNSSTDEFTNLNAQQWTYIVSVCIVTLIIVAMM